MESLLYELISDTPDPRFLSVFLQECIFGMDYLSIGHGMGDEWAEAVP